MASLLTLTYGRCKITNTYFGVFDDTIDLVEFNYLSFPEMMGKLASRILDDTIVRLERVESPGKFIQLSDDETEQLRTNTQEAIEAMTVPDRTLQFKEMPKVESTMKMRLNIGHDTLADAFGDRIYIRFHLGKVECLETGRYIPIDETRGLKHWGGMEEHENRWVSVPTAALLASDLDRFFIPRRWNVKGPWISKDDLRDRFEKYQGAKANV